MGVVTPTAAGMEMLTSRFSCRDWKNVACVCVCEKLEYTPELLTSRVTRVAWAPVSKYIPKWFFFDVLVSNCHIHT